MLVESKKYQKWFFQNADLLISDLDGTLAHSAAFRFVIRNYFQKDFMDPNFYFWFLRSFFKFIKHGKDAYSDGWKDYLKSLKININAKVHLKPFLYPGVKEFHQLLKEQNPKLKKIIVSETLPNIVEFYKDLLDYDEAYGLVENKGKLASKILNDYKRPIVIGDNIADKLILDEIDKQGIIRLGIFKYIFKKDKREGFDLYIRSWKTLEEILK